jgi:transglutaminase-like putative cysteine protease
MTERLPRHTGALLLAAFLGAVLLNLRHAALWCMPLAVVAAMWSWRSLPRGGSPLSRGLRITLVLLLTLGVLASFRTLNGLAAGATLLVAMGAAKLLEARGRRDWLIVGGVTLFLLLAACLDGGALWSLPAYVAELWLTCAALYAVGATDAELRVGDALRAAGRGLLFALPLALVLFLFVPRLPGSFWALPRQDVALTGLGDEMNPGSIDQLTESDDEALRVRFDGPVPPLEQRYWRGPVLHDFDGSTWRAGRGRMARQPALTFSGPAYRYQVTLQPAPHNALVALDLPHGTPEDMPFVSFAYDYQVVTTRPRDRTVTYTLQSSPGHVNADTLSTLGRAIDLAFRPDRNPRTIALGRQLRAAGGDDAALVQRVLDYFRRGGFEYTLTPPKLDFNSVDDFLFNTRRGFCGHYASAFVMLMRAAGVPARVVTGYLGGEWNPFGKYLVVRQSMAHAWAEVWLPGQGWTRVDPTAVVAPERLTRGAYDLNSSSVAGTRALFTTQWANPARQLWDAMNAWWQDEFLGFNFLKQMDLLGRMGFARDDWHALAWLLTGGFAVWAVWLGVALRPRLSARRDALGRTWVGLERRLAAVGLARAAHEGPLAYAGRVRAARPDLAAIEPLARAYAELRYGPDAGTNPAAAAAALRRLGRAARLFSARIRR